MSIESEIRTALGNYSGLTALVADRIRPVTADRDDTLPYVAYDIVSVVPENGLEGHLGKTQYRVQIDAWAADKRANVEPVRDAIRTAMANANASASPRNRWEDERDHQYEPGTKRFGISIDFMVWITT